MKEYIISMRGSLKLAAELEEYIGNEAKDFQVTLVINGKRARKSGGTKTDRSPELKLKLGKKLRKLKKDGYTYAEMSEAVDVPSGSIDGLMKFKG